MANRRSQFYNRISAAVSPTRFPWYPLLMLATIAFIVVATATVPWLLLIPILISAYRTVRLTMRRSSQLKKWGYFSGSQHFDHWIYEERLGRSVVVLALSLERTDPNTQEMFIPDDDTWTLIVPSWAVERRAEIARRIAESWKPAHFHFAEHAVDA
jgi:hypothetical protein